MTAPTPSPHRATEHYFRFHLPHAHLAPVFGGDWFALKAEAFARFFGTPVFLVGQTVVVAIWILLNAFGVFTFDIYPFILLNLAFSTQAAYAAPLILLAQNRQDERDRAQIIEDRSVAARTQADTEYLAREIASIRVALGDVVTTADLRDALEAIRDAIDTAMIGPHGLPDAE